MKISDLIRELEQILETRGDLMLKDEIEVLVELRQVETMQGIELKQVVNLLNRRLNQRIKILKDKVRFFKSVS